MYGLLLVAASVMATAAPAPAAAREAANRVTGVRKGMEYAQVRRMLLDAGWVPLDAEYLRPSPAYPDYPEVNCGTGWQATCSAFFFRGDYYFGVGLNPQDSRRHLPVEWTWRSHDPAGLARDRQVVKAVISTTRQGNVQVEERSPVIKAACGTNKVWLSWNNAVPNATLVTCDYGGTAHDNWGWLIETGLDDDETQVRRFSLGKVTSVAEFSRIGAQVPDAFTSHPWCSGVKPKTPLNAVFATLVKTPSESGDAPYCFMPHFFAGNTGTPLRRMPAADEVSPDVPWEEARLIAREVEMLRDWRREYESE
ncbi:hypothetical protein ORK51_00120 [Stenotrophomonas rhizophila]|uniref:hypothetical protein n=1 Tax=Stenotrophomonas rhizophila TaxID=216778 RepID=UPI00224AA138|nr:hypothetical protein [Stenotrophomonas rhizophila]MCX2918585.1 hypothetical protein [Stenotrophomonas rhizophila]